jgi:hypothetical protein
MENCDGEAVRSVDGATQVRWTRIMESAIKDSGNMLPARVVLEFCQASRPYRTFLEILPKGGEPRFTYGRFFDSEDAALEDFRKRVARL